MRRLSTKNYASVVIAQPNRIVHGVQIGTEAEQTNVGELMRSPYRPALDDPHGRRSRGCPSGIVTIVTCGSSHQPIRGGIAAVTGGQR